MSPLLAPVALCLALTSVLAGCGGREQAAGGGGASPTAMPGVATATAGETPADANGPALKEAEVRAFYAPLDTLEGALDAERACGMLARDFEGRFDTRHPDGSTTQRVVGRDQTCDDARAGAIALRGTLEKGPAPTNAFDVVRVDIAGDGQSAAAQYAQRFEIPGRLVIELRGTDTVVREDGRLVVRRSVGSEVIRNP